MPMIRVTHYTDPGCPWNYCASPSLTTLRWRYGSALSWQIVLSSYEDQPASLARAHEDPATTGLRFRRFGMPFSCIPRSEPPDIDLAARAVISTHLLDPVREADVLRALQLVRFATADQLDSDHDLRAALRYVDGLDVEAVLAGLDSPAVRAASLADRDCAGEVCGGDPERADDRAAGRHAGEGSPDDRLVRPVIVFANEAGRSLVVRGVRHVDAYESCIENLAPGLERRGPAESVEEALAQFPSGLTAREVSALLARDLDEPDTLGAEIALLRAAARGEVTRVALGEDALWRPAPGRRGPPVVTRTVGREVVRHA